MQNRSAHFIFVFIPSASNKQCLHPVFKGCSDSPLESTCFLSWKWPAVSGCWPESPHTVSLAVIKWIPQTLGTCQLSLPLGPGLTCHHIQRTSQCGVADSLGQVPVRICMRQEGYTSQPQSRVMCPDTRGPRMGKSTQKCGFLVVHTVTGNSKDCRLINWLTIISPL